MKLQVFNYSGPYRLTSVVKDSEWLSDYDKFLYWMIGACALPPVMIERPGNKR